MKQFKSINDFLNKWQFREKKKAIIDELHEQGILLFELQKEVEKKTGKDLDPFDLICHVAFEMPPLTRKERAENVKKRNYFAKYGDNARKVLENLLDKYADEGVENIKSLQILKLEPLTCIIHKKWKNIYKCKKINVLLLMSTIFFIFIHFFRVRQFLGICYVAKASK